MQDNQSTYGKPIGRWVIFFQLPALSAELVGGARGRAGALYQFSTVKKTSVTEVVIGWPLTSKILGCATAKNIRLRIKIVE